MKRNFNKAMKPDVPFEDWANENNVELPYLEKKQAKTPFVKKPIFIWATSAVAIILMVAIALPLILKQEAPAPTIYSAQDAISDTITIDSLYSNTSDFLLPSENQIIQYGSVVKDHAFDNDELILSYTIKTALYATNDMMNAFIIDYKILVYHHYEFYTYENYSGFLNEVSINEITVQYKITSGGLDSKIAFIYFAYNEFEYFLQVEGYEGVTEINDTTLQLLLEELLA